MSKSRCSEGSCGQAARKARCPSSGGKAKPVGIRTLRSLLRNPDGLGEGPFHFCADADCDVVYFDERGDEIYRRADLEVRVGLKETEDPVPVCYCFDFTRAMLREEIERTGTTTIPRRIKDGIAAGRCDCEVKNPQGSCCLGNVNAAVRSIQLELRGTQGELKS